MFEVVISLLFFIFASWQLWPHVEAKVRFLTSYLWKCDHKGRKGQDYIKDVPKGVWYYKCKTCLHKLENGKL